MGAPSSCLCVDYVCAIGNRSVAEVEGLSGFEAYGGDVAFDFGCYGLAVDGHCRDCAIGHAEIDGVGFFGTDVGGGRFAVFPVEVNRQCALCAEAFD